MPGRRIWAYNQEFIDQQLSLANECATQKLHSEQSFDFCNERILEQERKLAELQVKLDTVDYYLGLPAKLPQNPQGLSFNNYEEWRDGMKYLIEHRQKSIPEELKKNWLKEIDGIKFYMQSDVEFREKKKTDIANKEKQLKEFEASILAATNFIHDVEATPQVVLRDAHAGLLRAFQNYNKSHPQQSPSTRLVLLAIKEKLDKLVEIDENRSSFLSSDIASEQEAIQKCSYRIQYALLCGFVATMMLRVQEANDDSAFLDFLKAMQQYLHVDAYDDLPGDAKLKTRCIDLFNDFANQHPALYQVTVEKFATLENEYRAAHAQFKKSTLYVSPMQGAAKTLLHAIENDLKTQDQLEQANTYPLYTRLLKEGDLVINPDTDIHDRQTALLNLMQLEKKLPKTSSTKKAVVGGLLVFIGVAAIVTSLLLFPPITPFAAVLGTSLLVKGLLIAGMVAGAGVTAVGSTLFHFSRDRGTHAATGKLIEAGSKFNP